LVATWKARSLLFKHEKFSMSCCINDYGGAVCSELPVVEQRGWRAGSCGLRGVKLPQLAELGIS
jgi:hypothetical protein